MIHYIILLFFLLFIFYYYLFEYYYNTDYNIYYNYDNQYYLNNSTINNFNKHFSSDKCLDIKDNKLVLNKCNDNDTQKWGYNNYRFINTKINKCIDKNFNIVDCDKTNDKFVRVNLNNTYYYKLYTPDNCINVDNNFNFNIDKCDINNQKQLFKNINDYSFNNYDDELKINLYFEILKNYKIFQKDNKYSNEFKNNFNIHTFNKFYDFYIKFGDNYTSNDLDNLYITINDIIKKQNDIKNQIIGQSFEYNFNLLKDYILLDPNNDTGRIFKNCINKFNVFSFLDFKNKFGNNYKKDQLLSLYNTLLNDNKTDNICLSSFKNYIDTL